MIDKALVGKLLCVALVAALMLPLGTVLFPYVSTLMDGMQFQTLEAVASTAIGFGLYSLFG
jgi:hypothetical protein